MPLLEQISNVLGDEVVPARRREGALGLVIPPRVQCSASGGARTHVMLGGLATGHQGGPSLKIDYVVLDYANENITGGWPGVALTLQSRGGLSRPTVARAVPGPDVRFM